MALKISSLGYPDASTLANIPQIKKLKKYEDKVPRIESFLKTEFGFIKENDSDILAEEILKHL